MRTGSVRRSSPPARGDERSVRHRTVDASDRGSLSLEFALVVPLVFVLALLVFELLGTARDALVVQNAAREGARVAATHADDRVVRDTVRGALGGRAADVVVTPTQRVAGRLVHVEVSIGSGRGPLRTQLTARATAQVEPRTPR